MTTSELYQEAEDQWRLSDLADSGIGCLPNEIFSSKSINKIEGFFALQMQWLMNISQSPYDQWQHIYGKEVDVGKEQQEFKQQSTQKNWKKAESKRVLKLHLTDGRREVVGLEYSPISCLHTKLHPGVKVLISGPIRCANHVLLLEARNVRILGGEVEPLAIDNAYENVLLRALNKPINPNPKVDYNETDLDADTSSVAHPLPVRPAAPQPRPLPQPTPLITSLDDHDDDIFCDIDIDQITAAVPSQGNQASSREVQEAFDVSDDREVEMNLSHESPEARPPAPRSVATAPCSLVSDVPAIERSIDVCDRNYAFKLRGINLATIEQIMSCGEAAKCGARFLMLKAEIDAVVEVANVSHCKWSLGVLLADRTSASQLQVRFSDTVLEKLAQTSAREIQEMYSQRKLRPQIQYDIEKVHFSPQIDIFWLIIFHFWSRC